MLHMSKTTGNDGLTPLGSEIQGHLDRKGWSRSELARRTKAKLNVSTISRVMRGLLPATHENVEQIADALGVDGERLKRLAGLRVVTPPGDRDATVEYIAQKLTDLPPAARERAVDALGAQLDAITYLTEREAILAEIEREMPEMFAEALAAVRARRAQRGAADDTVPPGGE